MKKVVSIKNLTKSYKELKAVDNISFDLFDGEILGLLGPNGSGKTTTINCILSLLNFDEGSVTVFGKEMSPELYDIKSKIGVVFQEVALFEELNVYENIDYFCGLYIQSKEKRKKYVDDAICLVGLEDFKKFRPKQLSGGLLRRLNIACGIAHKPKLIFLDEPTVAVDPQSRNNILEGIKKLNQMGATVIYTSHYMEEVELLCSRIIIMDKGKIIANGTKEEFKDLITVDEKVSVEFNDEQVCKNILNDIKSMENVLDAYCDQRTLHVKYGKGKDNLGDLIDYIKSNNISYSKVFSELPTLNDVFLDLTGKELRD